MKKVTTKKPDWVIFSDGMGVESAAILARWDKMTDEERGFTWDRLIIITAQVGEEMTDTILLNETFMLEIMRRQKIRFVEVARAGHLEADGIVVLQDTRQPYRLHPEGAYKLSDELLASGTVPQFGGEHRCALKFKAFVIETWLTEHFAKEHIGHVYGYNVDEKSRIAKSDLAIGERNQMVFGFNSEEPGRIERAKKYDTPTRIGIYPLQEWGWNRQTCLDFLFKLFGVVWVKSACGFCPFSGEAAKGTRAALTRFAAHPEQSVHSLLVEYNSMCFNPRGQLYKKNPLQVILDTPATRTVRIQFTSNLDLLKWGLYRVRRIYSKKGKAIRAVELISQGDRKGMQALVGKFVAMELTPIKHHGIAYAYFQQRDDDSYPSFEGFYVAAPLFMQTKVRGPIEKFNERWDAGLVGVPHTELAAAA